MSVAITFTPDVGQIQQLTRRGGPVDQDMERRSRRVLSAAVAQAPVGKSRKGYVGGRMRASGHIAPYALIAGAWDVIFAVYYAGYVDQGTYKMRARPFLSGNLHLAVE
jgi:hypothetical protein